MSILISALLLLSCLKHFMIINRTFSYRILGTAQGGGIDGNCCFLEHTEISYGRDRFVYKSVMVKKRSWLI